MNDKFDMLDILVILPGIAGSILKKDGTLLWGPTLQTIVSYVRTLGESVQALRIEREDLECDDLGDGIRATGLLPYTLIPGLASFGGYTELTSYLQNAFKLERGDATREEGPPANYFEFPYDWRRDNRVSARRLKNLIDRELPKWREKTDNPSAKVILMGHSMGGLVARYYVECLEGFEKTRALITFGTPHRGSVTTLDYVIHGYKKFGLKLDDFTAAIRSMTSFYQLLPRYPMVLDTDGEWRRVSEIAAGKIPHLDKTRAEEAYRFHERIETDHERNKWLKEYKVDLLPVVGYGQPTLQSARLTASGVELGMDLPPSVEKQLIGGDGKVPRVSAIPIELHQQPTRWWPWNQRHATLQKNPTLLENLVQILASLQGDLGAPTRGPGQVPTDKGIALEIEEVYFMDEPVSIRVTANTKDEPSAVSAEIAPLSAGGEGCRLELRPEGGVWMGEAVGLPAGAYQVTVRLQGVMAEEITDIFEVA